MASDTYLARAYYQTAQGVGKNFVIPFPYLSQADIKVYFIAPGGIEAEQVGGYSFQSTNTLHFTLYPPAGIQIEIRRQTDNSALIAKLQAGETLTADEINLVNTQMLYMGQEQADATTALNLRVNALESDGGGTFDVSLLGKSLREFGITGYDMAGDAGRLMEALQWSNDHHEAVYNNGLTVRIDEMVTMPDWHCLITRSGGFYRRAYGTRVPGNGNPMFQSDGYSGDTYCSGGGFDGGLFGSLPPPTTTLSHATVVASVLVPNTIVDGKSLNDGVGILTISSTTSDPVPVWAAVPENPLFLYSVRGDPNHNTAFVIQSRSGNSYQVTPAPTAGTTHGMTVNHTVLGGHFLRDKRHNATYQNMSLTNLRGIQFFVYGDYMQAHHNISNDTAIDGGGGFRLADGDYAQVYNNNLNTSDDAFQCNPGPGKSIQYATFRDNVARTSQGSAMAYILAGKAIDEDPQTGSQAGSLRHCRAYNVIGLTGKDNDRRGYACKFNNGDGIEHIYDCWIDGMVLNQEQDNDDSIASIRVLVGRSGLVDCGVRKVYLNSPVGTPIHIFQANPGDITTPTRQVDFEVDGLYLSAASRTTGPIPGNDRTPAYGSTAPIARIRTGHKISIKHVRGHVSNGGVVIDAGTTPGDLIDSLVLDDIKVDGLQSNTAAYLIGNVADFRYNDIGASAAVGATSTFGLVMYAVVGSDLGVQAYAGTGVTDFRTLTTPIFTIPGTAVNYGGSSGAQPVNANLTAIAGLTTAADRAIYWTGSGTAALFTLTTFARSFLDDADASTVLSTLGISTFIKTLLDDVDASTALGTLGVSAYAKTLLDDIDASTAQSTLGISTFIKTLLDDADASTALSTLGVTTYAKTILAAVDAATMRGTLGLGSAALLSSTAIPLLTSANVFSTDQAITVAGTGVILSITGEGSTAVKIKRYSTNGTSPNTNYQKAGGTAASPVAVLTNYDLGQLSYDGWTGSAFTNAAKQTFTVLAATPSSGDMYGAHIWTACVSGSATPTEVLRVDHTNGLSFKGTSVVKARQTGHAAATGTASSVTYVTYATGTASATYLQSEIQGLRDHMQVMSQQVKALKDALIAHGLIGP